MRPHYACELYSEHEESQAPCRDFRPRTCELQSQGRSLQIESHRVKKATTERSLHFVGIPVKSEQWKSRSRPYPSLPVSVCVQRPQVSFHREQPPCFLRHFGQANWTESPRVQSPTPQGCDYKCMTFTWVLGIEPRSTFEQQALH